MSRNIERENWSEASKSSRGYYEERTSYEDYSYICRKCSTPTVFTGEEQKHSYEVRKNYIWQRRRLCSLCHADLHKLKLMNSVFQERWSKEKAMLEQDSAFLTEWIAVLNAFPSYGSRIGGGMTKRLGKLLDTCLGLR